MIVLLLLWHNETVKAALKSMGDYGYSEARYSDSYMAKTGRQNRWNELFTDMYCHSIVKTAAGGVLPM